ncbi:hypothetical protein K438DRAFT_1768874 [Mycena galopus ATCC 62051]|nr:hypothetical protein K438DRAFT_1768874 [Mycena galopus ATCC 62051]
MEKLQLGKPRHWKLVVDGSEAPLVCRCVGFGGASETSEAPLSAPVLPPPPVTTNAIETNSTVVVSAPTAAEVSVADPDTADQSRRRRARTKRKAAPDVECICSKVVAMTERESSAVQCARAGCETIWFHIECVPPDMKGLGLQTMQKFQKAKIECLRSVVVICFV